MTTEETQTIQGLDVGVSKSNSYAHVLAEEMAKLVDDRIDPIQTLALTKITFWVHGEEVEFEFDVRKYEDTEITGGRKERVTEYSREIVKINRRSLLGDTPPPPAPAVTREPI